MGDRFWPDRLAGPRHYPLKVKTTGSNPVQATKMEENYYVDVLHEDCPWCGNLAAKEEDSSWSNQDLLQLIRDKDLKEDDAIPQRLALWKLLNEQASTRASQRSDGTPKL